MRKPFARVLLLVSGILLLLFLHPNPLSAQTTRAQKLAAKQAEKAKSLKKYEMNKAEEWVKRIQDWGLTSAPRGVYPFFGSAYSGGGITLGAGVRRFYSDTGTWDVHGAWSFANYRMLDATFKLPDMAADTIQSKVNAHYIHADKVPYFGLGNDTPEEAEASYLYNPLSASYTLHFRPGRGGFLLGGEVEYVRHEIGEGQRSGVPSIEEVFNPVTAPGLGTNPEYLIGKVEAEFDWRQSPGYSTSGGLYRVEWQNYSEQNNLNLDFQRVDVEARQFIPILRANQVLALRALASFTDIKDTNEIPFFLYPKLGGGEELRGFGDFRFRDRHRMLLTAEYRWTPSKFIDMAVFYEAGKVAAQTEDLDFKDLHGCWGIGIRFHTPAATPLRIEFAHSEEANRIIFSGGTSF